jgi:selenide,water dikinase
LEIDPDPDLLVGLEGSDDAGVYKISDDLALVQTVDFFTPIVDDPYLFGQIAVANGLSDVYAMGGTPLTAMNISCFPIKKMDISILSDILRGGLDKMKEAGVALVGGHSIDDPELKYGISVTGTVHPEHILTNHGSVAGDALVLTKPLGTGIINTAVKGNKASPESEAAAVASMCALNSRAADVAGGYRVHACTDLTGFGLLGHAAEMLVGTGLAMIVDASSVPLLPGVQQYCEMGLLPGGLQRNREYRLPMVEVRDSVPQHLLDVMWDPQTSGGLLIALPPEEAAVLVDELAKSRIAATVIGTIIENDKEKIIIE